MLLHRKVERRGSEYGRVIVRVVALVMHVHESGGGAPEERCAFVLLQSPNLNKLSPELTMFPSRIVPGVLIMGGESQAARNHYNTVSLNVRCTGQHPEHAHAVLFSTSTLDIGNKVLSI